MDRAVRAGMTGPRAVGRLRRRRPRARAGRAGRARPSRAGAGSRRRLGRRRARGRAGPADGRLGPGLDRGRRNHRGGRVGRSVEPRRGRYRRAGRGRQATRRAGQGPVIAGAGEIAGRRMRLRIASPLDLGLDDARAADAPAMIDPVGWLADEAVLLPRGAAWVVDLAAAAGHPSGAPLRVHAARQAPVGAVYLGEDVGVLVNPVLLASLEPAGTRQPSSSRQRPRRRRSGRRRCVRRRAATRTASTARWQSARPRSGCAARPACPRPPASGPAATPRTATPSARRSPPATAPATTCTASTSRWRSRRWPVASTTRGRPVHKITGHRTSWCDSRPTGRSWTTRRAATRSTAVWPRSTASRGTTIRRRRRTRGRRRMAASRPRPASAASAARHRDHLRRCGLRLLAAVRLVLLE